LRELRHEERGDLALGGLALVLALAATRLAPQLAVPLFVGGAAVVGLGVRALWRHWDLVDRLAGEPDAYLIGEVRTRAVRETTMARRRANAAAARAMLEAAESGSPLGRRISAVAHELDALAYELEDERLRLDPACAVACTRLLTDAASSPLLDVTRPSDDLRSRLRRIRSGFTPGPVA
jgi:hypothetical protein